MRSPRRITACVISLAGLLAGAVLVAAPMTSQAAEPARPSTTNSFRGVNWADPRDNFVPDAVVPTGLSTGDSYATTRAKADQILDGFTHNLGANTVRLPINPQSVGTTWWNSYRGAIDAATTKGYKVILSYWENQPRDGKIDNLTTFNAMWKTVVSAYGTNANVYFEPMNEPHGYSYAQWSAQCADWLSRFASVPRGRVIISGTGYNTDVKALGADSRFTGTLLSVHDYKFFSSNTTYAQFKAQIAGEVGTYASRTIIDEFGVPQTNGTNFHQANSTDPYINFLQAITDFARQNSMGTVYWPGLRTNDGYSIQKLTGTYPNLVLTTTNSSGRDLILGSWGLGNARTGTITTPAGKCLDVKSTTSGNPKVVIATCSGSPSQQWTLSNGALTSGGKCADASGAGTADGTPIIAYPCSGHPNQQWVLLNHQFRNGNSGTCLNIPSPATVGTQLVLAACTTAANQTWSLND